MDLQRSWFPLIKTDKGNVNIADFKRAGMFAANKLIIDNAPGRTVTKISFAEHNYIKFPQQLSLQITDGLFAKNSESRPYSIRIFNA